MDIVQVARAMSKRIPWPVALRLLREHEIPRSQGWEKTIEAFGAPQADYSEKEEELQRALVEHWLCGEKLVRFYRVTVQQRDELLSAIDRLEVPESSFKDAFPDYLAADALQSAPIDPTIVRVGRNDEGVGVAYGSRFTERASDVDVHFISQCDREEGDRFPTTESNCGTSWFVSRDLGIARHARG